MVYRIAVGDRHGYWHALIDQSASLSHDTLSEPIQELGAKRAG
jgi:hypothetical protein